MMVFYIDRSGVTLAIYCRCKSRYTYGLSALGDKNPAYTPQDIITPLFCLFIPYAYVLLDLSHENPLRQPNLQCVSHTSVFLIYNNRMFDFDVLQLISVESFEYFAHCCTRVVQKVCSLTQPQQTSTSCYDRRDVNIWLKWISSLNTAHLLNC